MPMSRRLAGMSVMSRPSSRTRPESSRSSPASERSAVVLPQPEGPSSATSSPGARSSDRPSSALTSPNRRRSSTSWTRTPARDGLAPATAAGGARASGCRLIGPLTRTLARPLWSMNDSRNRSAGRQQQRCERDRDRDARIALAEQVDHDLQGLEVQERRDRELAQHQGDRDQRCRHDRAHDVGHDDPPDHAEPGAAEAAAGLGEGDEVERRRDRRPAPGRRTAAPGRRRRRSSVFGDSPSRPQTHR